jgi:hypothetical protein
MEKKIEICIGTDRAGGVRARLSLLVYEGEQQLFEHYHSVMLMPTDDPAETRARVETHLAMPTAQSGIPLGPWPAIPEAEWRKVVAVCNAMQPNSIE